MDAEHESDASPSASTDVAGPTLGMAVGLGCLTIAMIWAGFFAGGMIAVGIGKAIGSMRDCKPAEGLPACDWQMYWFTGGTIGALVLPIGVWWRRLRRRSGL